MVCGFTQERIAQIQARIERWETQLSNAYDVLDTMMSHDVDEYRFQSGEGSQWVTRRKIKEQQQLIDDLERKIDHWVNRLNGKGIIYSDLRRRG